jgi:hypothetical protein
MRTDSVNLSSLAINTAKAEIISEFGENYHKARQYKTTAKGAQEAHEAIRPTYMDVEKAGANNDERRLYDLIRKRAIASQMADAETDTTRVEVAMSDSPYLWVANYSVITFDGFMRVYTQSSDDELSAQLSTLNSQLSINGSLKDNHFDGNLALTLPYTTFDLDGNRLADSLALHANVPAEVNLDIMHINLKNALIAINSHELNLNGVAQLDNDDINLDMQFATNQWNLEEVIALIPETYADILDGINISGIASLSGSARGTYNDNTTPLISANLNYTNGKVQYPALLPFPLNNINLTLAAKINLTENSQLSILNSQLITKCHIYWFSTN